MLGIPFKRSDKADFVKVLTKFIKATYGQGALEKHNETVNAVQTLSDEFRQIETPQEFAKDLIRRYYCELYYLEVHFPFLQGNAPKEYEIEFTWYDAFQTRRRGSSRNVALEKAGVLFNLAALYSQQAVTQDLASSEGLRVACNQFQVAAGIVEHIRDELVPPLQVPPTGDLTKESLDVLQRVLLAQAQVCFVRKAALGNMKNAIVAKLAAQAADYYDQALQTITAYGAVAGDLDKIGLPATVRLEIKYWTAEAEYRQASVCHEAMKYGEGVARLGVASALLTDSANQRLLRSAPEGVHRNYSDLTTVVAAALDAAVKDNNVIYMNVVPDAAALAAIEKKAMVRPFNAQDVISEVGSAGSDPWTKLTVDARKDDRCSIQ